MHLVSADWIVFGATAAWLRPLWIVVAGAVGAAALLWAAFHALRMVAPKVAAIARTTSKEAMSQPLFYGLWGIGWVAMLIFLFISYYTFGEDVKMVKSEGLTLIKLLGIILAVWTASVSIAEELEGRTALTLLSKPIGRRQLILGKYLGILGPVAILFILLSAMFLASVSYKVVYDARESSKPDPTASDCYEEMVQVVPGLALAFMETMVLASVSVAISTRLPMLPNLVICVSIYVLGHLVPILVNSQVGKEIVFVRFVGDFSSAVLPVLDHFNMETAISTGQTVPWAYVLWTALYCAVYCGVAMLLALLLFEDRDLA